MYFMVHKEIDHKFPKNFTIQNFRSLSSQENNPYSAAYYTIKSYRENEIDVNVHPVFMDLRVRMGGS